MTKIILYFPTRLVFVLVILSFLVMGCKKENPNPELLDPIYKDLVDKHKVKEKQLKDEEKALEGLEKEFQTVQPRSMTKVTLLKSIKKNKMKVKMLRQHVKFLKIRMDRRKVEGRRKYRIAFAKGEAWPDPKELENYKLNEKLRSVDLNWNKRVPKLHHNNPNFKKSSK